jgi:hypothetical protein
VVILRKFIFSFPTIACLKVREERNFSKIFGKNFANIRKYWTLYQSGFYPHQQISLNGIFPFIISCYHFWQDSPLRTAGTGELGRGIRESTVMAGKTTGTG